MLNNKRIIYADHSATTKVRTEVIEAMLKVLQGDYGNPSSIHQFGRKAKIHLETARENIASVINANQEQIFFTSGGTESNNTVIFSVLKLVEEDKLRNKDKHIISTKIEHSAVKEPLEYLEKKGWKITWLNVSKEGFIDFNELQSFITPKTALVSIIHANNEIGTMQDLKRIGTICRNNNVLFHTDAVQSFGKVPIDVKNLNIDFLSASSHKLYGPKGVGTLYIRFKDEFAPLLIGGGQEQSIRSGTENLPGIVGFGVAAKLLKSEMHENAIRLRKLQIKLMQGLLDIEGVILTGVELKKVLENQLQEKYLYRIPGHVSICCKDVPGESLVLQTDLKGIAASSGSACKSKDINSQKSIFEPSHVLVAIGVSKDYVKGSLRLSLGRDNTEEEVTYIIKSSRNIVESLNKNVAISSK